MTENLSPVLPLAHQEKRQLLILGAGVMQGPALKIAAEMGLEAVAADADPGAPSVPFAARFFKVDLKDKEGIEALARSLMKKNGGLGGVMTAGTDFSATAAWVAEKLGLPGIPYENALDASDKERMRRRFEAANVPSPQFVIMKNPPEEGFELPFSWPAVVKPVDNMGSRGCRKVKSYNELKNAVIEAFTFSRAGRVIVEEFMEGPEFSVDALVYQGEITICGIADRHIFFPPYFIEMGHTMPSAFDPAVLKSLLEVFCRGVKALGINNGAAKGDIKLTPKGPMIGEIAARLSGGYMSGWTYPYSSGVLPTRAAIEIALGQKPGRLEPEWNWTAAERAFISIPGKVRSIEGIEKARVMPSIKDVFLRIKPGDAVNFPENNVGKCGNIINAAENRDDAVNSAEKAAQSILIRLEAPNKTTGAFLSVKPGESTFPPDAFTLDSRLLSLLAALPVGDNSLSSVPRTNGLRIFGSTCLRVMNFKEFLDSGLRDYMGRSVQESLDAVRTLTGLELPVVQTCETPFLGRTFWQALIRGGYQGAVYYIDSLKGEMKSEN